MAYEAFRHSRRKLFLYFAFCVFVLGVFLFWSNHSLFSSLSIPQAQCDPDPPSNWDKLYKWEDELPQHDVNLPFPEGKEGRYVYFHNQIQMLGWNNQLNEVFVHFFCFIRFLSTEIRIYQSNEYLPRI